MKKNARASNWTYQEEEAVQKEGSIIGLMLIPRPEDA